MTHWSYRVARLSCLARKPPSQGRTAWPTAKGSNSCRTISFRASATENPEAPDDVTSMRSRNGVSIIPNTFDAAALQMAAGTLPLAMAVYAMDEDTAEGRTPRYRKPSPKSGGIQAGAIALNCWIGSTASGKNTNVNAVIIKCSRQWVAPAMI